MPRDSSVRTPPAHVRTAVRRPKTRGDCSRVPRPCPYVSCRHHLYLDVQRDRTRLLLPFPDIEPDELEHSCSLDLAERDGMTLGEVGEVMGVCRERIRQIERDGLRNLSHKMRVRRLTLVGSDFAHGAPDESVDLAPEIDSAVEGG